MTNSQALPLPGILTGDTLIITLPSNSEVLKIPRSHMNFDRILEAFYAGDEDEVNALQDPTTTITNYYGDQISIKTESGEVLFEGEPVPSALAFRVVECVRNGANPQNLLNFFTLLRQNTSMRNIEDLYAFCEKHMFAITGDGHLLLYKKVNADYTDCYTGKFDNTPGQTVTMPRNKVDDDPNNTCSKGLHVCGKEYLQHFGGARIVLVKVNPKDIVSIPRDYNHAKMRTCCYQVLKDVTGEQDREWDFANEEY